MRVPGDNEKESHVSVQLSSLWLSVQTRKLFLPQPQLWLTGAERPLHYGTVFSICRWNTVIPLSLWNERNVIIVMHEYNAMLGFGGGLAVLIILWYFTGFGRRGGTGAA